MSPFMTAFHASAASVLSECDGLEAHWIDDPIRPKLTLAIPAPHAGGFGVRLECESYGLYPYAEGWRGAPWDVTVYSPEKLGPAVREFLWSVLSPDSELKVMSRNGRAYRWILRYRFDGEIVSDATESGFLNWFGTKTAQSLQNHVLPPNQSLQRSAASGAR